MSERANWATYDARPCPTCSGVMTDRPYEYKYRGLTYPHFLASKPIRWLWERLCCPKDIHLLDEVWSSPFYLEPYHYLSCDVCGLVVNIESVDDEHVSRAVTDARAAYIAREEARQERMDKKWEREMERKWGPL